MGAELQEALKSLCCDTEWKYAVFWKLKHRARMVLTLEDAYCENYGQHDNLENKFLGVTSDHKFDGHLSHDSLGLAVAKMSYHVYSLGEGIVGQVAALGNHQWIFTDNFPHTCSIMEYWDGWKAQFLAGIKTVVIIAVVPHGVVQLGSLNKIVENLKLVDHVRDIFSAFHTSPAFQSFNEAINEQQPNAWPHMVPVADKFALSSSASALSNLTQNMALDMPNKLGGKQGLEPPCGESTKLIGLKSENTSSEKSQQKSLSHIGYEGDTPMAPKLNDKLWSNNPHEERIAYDASFLADDIRTPLPYFSSIFSESLTFEQAKFDDHLQALNQDQGSQVLDSSDVQRQEAHSTKLDNNQTDLGISELSNVSFMFSAGCELHEALGPAFSKQSSNGDRQLMKAKSLAAVELPESLISSQSTSDSGAEHLLEAVVANICATSAETISESLFHQSMQSLMAMETFPKSSGTSKQGTHSIYPSIFQKSLEEESLKNHLNSSESCFLGSPTGFLSTCTSTCSEPSGKSSEPLKGNKKRARPGESSRPRPRDRQLIQDRIKELRELVPSGSKCSIDSLLERTIKHMLFLQSITQHADKLTKCAESKMRNKETSLKGSSGQEQGSSWAVEVGSHLKVCTIIVENVNMNGQMLVEMLCEECGHFLEIAEAIRSLGLTILKGVTEACGEKTWICFVVEGQNNRNMHRMDILWSLVNLLQPKNAV